MGACLQAPSSRVETVYYDSGGFYYDGGCGAMGACLQAPSSSVETVYYDGGEVCYDGGGFYYDGRGRGRAHARARARTQATQRLISAGERH